MAKLTEAYRARGGRTLVLSDFSPPRGAGMEFLDDARMLDVDFICVAYNPGRAVRVDSAMLAAAIKRETPRDVIFNLSPRDMNPVALESHLLGAAVLGLENVLVVAGDPFSPRDLELVTPVGNFTSTALIQAVAQMNQGMDFRGRKLAASTDICVGAAVDLGKGIHAEARLAHRKVQAGAQFLVTQPIFQAEEVARFQEAYQGIAAQPLSVPVLWGLQLLVQGGVIFSSVPEGVQRDLEQGMDGVEIALEMWGRLLDAGAGGIYLMAPILRGGLRDYEAARRFLAQVRP